MKQNNVIIEGICATIAILLLGGLGWHYIHRIKSPEVHFVAPAVVQVIKPIVVTPVIPAIKPGIKPIVPVITSTPKIKPSKIVHKSTHKRIFKQYKIKQVTKQEPCEIIHITAIQPADLF